MFWPCSRRAVLVRNDLDYGLAECLKCCVKTRGKKEFEHSVILTKPLLGYSLAKANPDFDCLRFSPTKLEQSNFYPSPRACKKRARGPTMDSDQGTKDSDPGNEFKNPGQGHTRTRRTRFTSA